ncbi:gpW family head-tail joining protein [Brevundimonas sp.]|uniref:gpW family head-tail joining protein n=1 Tax=Brevundimonas sp. TaxID=1871086 RepID=UPI0022C1CEB0|nr:gpW family head-tail joining protein [Brevundimonas sp.]MCZ8195018.1 gpW family head-tail joining protein [Brevundimonas sp.]
MALSAEDAARLQQLQTARDELMGGRRVSRVQSNGRTVEYAAGSLADVVAEIDRLEALAKGAPAARRGVMRFRFR